MTDIGSSPRKRLTPQDHAEIRRRVASGESMASVARAFGVSRPRISQIVNGKRIGFVVLRAPMRASRR